MKKITAKDAPLQKFKIEFSRAKRILKQIESKQVTVK